MPATYLADLSGSHLHDAVHSAALAILPLGRIEYHGQHGALGTDFFLAHPF